MAGRVYVKDVLGRLQNHLQKHDDKYDIALDRHELVLYGEKGDNGLCARAKDHERRIMDIEKVRDEIRQVKWAVVIEVLVLMGAYLMKLI